MSWLRRFFLVLGAIALIAVAAFLHWTLPSRDIVRITGTDVVRSTEEVTSAAGQEVSRTRDVRYINTVDTSGKPMVYRNEDTGWGWPPYFKFNSADLAAKADNAISSEEAPRWMVLTHYGWRFQLFSTFPNAVEIHPAEGPDQSLIPWFNMSVVAILLAIGGFIWWRMRAFFRKRAEASTS